MKNVGNGKVILKGCNHQHHGRKKDDGKAGNAGATRGFTQPLRCRSLDDECQQTCQEGVGAQRQREEKRKTTYLRHGGNLGLYFFRNHPYKQPRKGWSAELSMPSASCLRAALLRCPDGCVRAYESITTGGLYA